MSALLASVSMVGCDRHGRDASAKEDGADRGDITGASNFYLKEEVLQLEVQRALDGDQQAADRVYMHFSTTNPQDRQAQVFWARVAAENGSTGYMYLYASMLYEDGGHEQCRRALFWLRRASELSPEMVEKNARLIDEIEADRKCRRSGER